MEVTFRALAQQKARPAEQMAADLMPPKTAWQSDRSQLAGDPYLRRGLCYFTAPKVSLAIKCRCIRKNIVTGGKAATIEPALIR